MKEEEKNPFNPLLFNSAEEMQKHEEGLLEIRQKTKPNHWEWNEEQKKRCSERAKIRFSNKENHPNYGKHLSNEWKKKIGDGNKGRINNLSKEEKEVLVEKLRQSWTPEMRKAAGERMSKWFKGKPNCRTPPASNTRDTSVQGVREDLNQFFRSTWEANLARILNHLNIKWAYEPYRFTFEHFSYVPDFYLPETGSWVEVYSWMPKLKAEKIHAMGEVANLQLVDHGIYDLLEAEYKDKIPGWEIGKRVKRR